MKFEDLYPRKRVLICPDIGGQNTKNTQGWDNKMDQYVGTEQTIDIINQETVRFRGDEIHNFTWDIRDLVSIPEEEELTLQGKKTTFDEKELLL
jgi:hypothetical protein